MKTTKKCKKCHLEKPVEEFYYNQGYRRTECKVCYKARCTKYNRQNKIWQKESKVQYQREYMKFYQAAHKEKFKEASRRFRERNPGYFSKRLSKQDEE